MSKQERKPGSSKRKFSDSEKKKILQGFKVHRGPKEAFFRAQGVTGSAVYRVSGSKRPLAKLKIGTASRNSLGMRGVSAAFLILAFGQAGKFCFRPHFKVKEVVRNDILSIVLKKS